MRLYTRVRKLDPSSLSKDELGELSQIINTRVTLGTVQAGVHFIAQTPDMQLSAETLNELLESDGLPPHLRTLTVRSEVKAPLPQEQVRSVELKFAPTMLECTVSAADSHWVRGTFEEVEVFLRRKRPKTWPLRKHFSFLIAATLGAIIGFFLTAGIYLDWLYQGAILVTFYTMLSLQILHSTGKFFSYSDVALQGDRPLITLGRANFVLAVIGTAIAVAGYIQQS